MEPRKLTSILPTVSRLPNLSASRDISDRIIRLVLAEFGAGRDEEAKAAVNASVEAAKFYVMAKVYEMPMRGFRGMISKGSSVRTAIETLVELLPESSHQPPFAQMRNLFCSGDPSYLGDEECILEGLSPLEVDKTLGEVNEKEDSWEEAYSPEVILRALKQWLSLMDNLQPFLPVTKVPKDFEKEFVISLLEFWRETLGLTASNTRINGRQGGAFADFVRLATEIIPDAVVPNKPKNWDNQIRLVLEGEIYSKLK